MTPEEHSQHAKNLMEFPSWAVFTKDLSDLKELKASEMVSGYMNDRGYAGAFAAGFRLGLETAAEWPQRTIKKNKSVIQRMKEAVDRFAERSAE